MSILSIKFQQDQPDNIPTIEIWMSATQQQKTVTILIVGERATHKNCYKQRLKDKGWTTMESIVVIYIFEREKEI